MTKLLIFSRKLKDGQKEVMLTPTHFSIMFFLSKKKGFTTVQFLKRLPITPGSLTGQISLLNHRLRNARMPTIVHNGKKYVYPKDILVFAGIS